MAQSYNYLKIWFSEVRALPYSPTSSLTTHASRNQRTLSVLKSRQDSWSHWAPGVQVWSANSTAADRWAIPPSDLGTALHFDTATKLQSIINTLAIVAEDDSLGEHVFFPTGFENTIGTPPFGSSFVHDNVRFAFVDLPNYGVCSWDVGIEENYHASFLHD